LAALSFNLLYRVFQRRGTPTTNGHIDSFFCEVDRDGLANASATTCY
jgi:hypothetical protein